jgi:catalase
MPETSHMLMWLMSDRAIPRSYRMMEGFGVHTFRFVNARGVSHFVKFHWSPSWASTRWPGTRRRRSPARTRTSTARPVGGDRARRLPEWELGVQLIDEDRAASSASTCWTRPS